MIRESLTPGSRHFSLFISRKGGGNNDDILQWIWRSTTGGSSADQRISINDNHPKVWLQVHRNGIHFAAYYRRNANENWIPLGGTSIPSWTSTSCHVGIAVTSHDNNGLAQLLVNYLTTTKESISSERPSVSYHNIKGPFCQGYCSAGEAVEDFARSEVSMTNKEKIGLLALNQGVSDLSVTSAWTRSPTCFPIIKSVKLQQTTNQPLQIYELEILNRLGSNIAKGKTATSSSAWPGDPASNSVDGDLTTIFHSAGDHAAWLKIDLGASLEAKTIVIYNRSCGNDVEHKCLCRLSDATLSIYGGSGEEVASLSVGNTCGKAKLEYKFCNAPVSNRSKNCLMNKVTNS